VMWLLIVVNLVVFFVQASGGSPQMNQTDHVAGVIPVAFTGHSVGGLWPPLTLITHQFLHINFGHVFGNMIFLFVFGDDIEEVLGLWRFLAFYLLCGIGAGLVFVLSSLDSNRPLIGASGAVAGVLSAYLLFRPCARVTCLLGLIPLRLRAYWIICGWAIWQVVEAANRVQNGVAYWGHIGDLVSQQPFSFLRPPLAPSPFSPSSPSVKKPRRITQRRAYGHPGRPARAGGCAGEAAKAKRGRPDRPDRPSEAQVLGPSFLAAKKMAPSLGPVWRMSRRRDGKPYSTKVVGFGGKWFCLGKRPRRRLDLGVKMVSRWLCSRASGPDLIPAIPHSPRSGPSSR